MLTFVMWTGVVLLKSEKKHTSLLRLLNCAFDITKELNDPCVGQSKLQHEVKFSVDYFFSFLNMVGKKRKKSQKENNLGIFFGIPAKYLCLPNVDIHFIWSSSFVQPACFVCLIILETLTSKKATLCSLPLLQLRPLPSPLSPLPSIQILLSFLQLLFPWQRESSHLAQGGRGEEAMGRSEKTGGEQCECAQSSRGSHFPRPCLCGRD